MSDGRRPWAALRPNRASVGLLADRSSVLLESLVRHAILAPSGHNTQPWSFRTRDGALELFADRTRALPVVDPDDRELVISCGAALALLRVALRHSGYAGEVELFPDPTNSDLLARLRLGEPAEVTELDTALFHAIARRHTNRHPFDHRPVPDELLGELVDLARAEGVWLRVVTDLQTKRAIADLIAEGNRRQAADPAFRRELAAWMRSNATRSHDGMPGYAHGFGDVASTIMPFFMRTFDWGKHQAAKDWQLVMGSPALLVLGTEEDSAREWVRAGQALGGLLLRACADGVTASFLNQPIEVATLRPRLARTLGVRAFPQLLLRIGYGLTPRATPRRDVAEILTD